MVENNNIIKTIINFMGKKVDEWKSSSFVVGVVSFLSYIEIIVNKLYLIYVYILNVKVTFSKILVSDD